MLSSELRQTAVTGSLLQHVQLFEVGQEVDLAETNVTRTRDHSQAGAITWHTDSINVTTQACAFLVTKLLYLTVTKYTQFRHTQLLVNGRIYYWHRTGG